jgi:ABC-2 type transport system ATP-binding protein
MVTVSVDGLRARHGKHVVLDGLTLRMGTGVHGLLGPNGAGKTTLMRTLATIKPPAAGMVRLLDLDPEDRNARTEIRKRLGYLPQAFGYYQNFTVAEFVEYMAWLKEIPRDRVSGAVDRAISRVSLSSRAESKMKTLSGGDAAPRGDRPSHRQRPRPVAPG